MEVSQKEANRSKWRSSARRGRGRGRHVGAGRGGGSSRHRPELDSNYDRYASDADSDQEAGSLPARQSQGADLAQLLEESEQFYVQAHFRYRSFIEAVDTEPPPVDMTAFEQALVLEAGPLIQALSQLPLTQLLGLPIPAAFLEGVARPAPQQQHHVMVQEGQQARQQTQPAGQVSSQHPHQQLQHSPQEHQQVIQPHTSLQPSAAPASAAAPPAPAPAAAAAAAATGTVNDVKDDDDDDDELLDLLLGGGGEPTQPSARPVTSLLGSSPLPSSGAGSSNSSWRPPHSQPAVQQASRGAATTTSSSSSSSRSSSLPQQDGGLPARQGTGLAHPVAAALSRSPNSGLAAAASSSAAGRPPPATPPPAAAPGLDDPELDALLGL